MAVRGARPRLAVVEGRGVDGEAIDLPEVARIEPPRGMKGRTLELWHEACGLAPWLVNADRYKLHAWAIQQAKFERAPNKQTASDRRELRASGSELGLDPTARQRMRIKTAGSPPAPTGRPAGTHKTPGAKFFGDE